MVMKEKWAFNATITTINREDDGREDKRDDNDDKIDATNKDDLDDQNENNEYDKNNNILLIMSYRINVTRTAL